MQQVHEVENAYSLIFDRNSFIFNINYYFHFIFISLGSNFG